ncbi:hypothetical protein U1Q18_043270 [Sarracenia purpurea var. burkii]
MKKWKNLLQYSALFSVIFVPSFVICKVSCEIMLHPLDSSRKIKKKSRNLATFDVEVFIQRICDVIRAEDYDFSFYRKRKINTAIYEMRRFIFNDDETLVSSESEESDVDASNVLQQAPDKQGFCVILATRLRQCFEDLTEQISVGSFQMGLMQLKFAEDIAKDAGVNIATRIQWGVSKPGSEE